MSFITDTTTYHRLGIQRTLLTGVNAMSSITDTTTVTEPETEVKPKPCTSNGDHDRYAHYVLKTHSLLAYVEGIPVRALCGKVWIPSRDPSLYPVCPTCAEIRDGLPKRNESQGGE